MTIDLSQLPPPAIIEGIDYEALLADALADFALRYPDHADLTEADPAVKVLETYAYRDMLARRRVNDAALAVMLPYAAGADLDQIGARFNTPRLVLDPGDPSADPPRPKVTEPDEDYRQRIPLALEAVSTAGPEGAYRYHALAAHAQVKSVGVLSPLPGTVRVVVLTRIGDGTAAPEVLAAVDERLSDRKVRPLCDTVQVVSAEVVPYTVRAILHVPPGPDAAVVRTAAGGALSTYAEACQMLGGVVALSGLSGALHRPSVSRVTLLEPAADVITQPHQAPYFLWAEITVERDA